jgi:hypothetical protein
LSELSTRVWLDERLWDGLRRRAVAEKVTVRELIPRLVARAMGEGPAAAVLPAATVPRAPTAATTQAESDLPVIPLAELYRCAVCEGQVKLGALAMHMNKHMKEQQAPNAERS